MLYTFLDATRLIHKALLYKDQKHEVIWLQTRMLAAALVGICQAGLPYSSRDDTKRCGRCTASSLWLACNPEQHKAGQQTSVQLLLDQRHCRCALQLCHSGMLLVFDHCRTHILLVPRTTLQSFTAILVDGSKLRLSTRRWVCVCLVVLEHASQYAYIHACMLLGMMHRIQAKGIHTPACIYSHVCIQALAWCSETRHVC